MTATQLKKRADKVGVVTEGGAISRAFRALLKDRMAFFSLLVLISLYFMVGFANFLAPYSEGWYRRDLARAVPTAVYIVDDETRQLTWPYVYRYERTFDDSTYEYSFNPVTDKKYPLQLFVHGEPYQMWGFIESDVHLFGVEAPGVISLLGTDMNGRDNFSRLLFGGQISLTIGFLALFIVFPIGLIYGGISGYFGGWIDNLMMRFAEIIMSIPSFYLLISLAAIIPPSYSSSERFMMVTLILALVGWAGLSRTIRGMVLSLKNMEYIEASRAIGMLSVPIIVRHILPQTASFVIVALTIGVPSYILAESGLSFLGLGILQPDASWGNMLKEAQDITNIATRPWMLMPGYLIFVAVLAFNVIGDAIRDVLDPKSVVRR